MKYKLTHSIFNYEKNSLILALPNIKLSPIIKILNINNIEQQTS